GASWARTGTAQFRLPARGPQTFGAAPTVGPVQIRAVHPDEHDPAGRLVVAAYQALPGNHMTGGYAAELADVKRRAIEAEVLVAVDEALLGCVTFVPDASSPWAEMLQADESGIRMLAVLPAAQGRGVG